MIRTVLFLPIAIIAIVFSFVLIIIKMSQEHELEKHRLTRGTDKSLTVSELNDLVADAVEEALAPLQERIRELESGTEASSGKPLQLDQASRRLELDELDLADDSSEDMVSSPKKRVR